MHELGVTFHIMDHLEKVAAENKVTHVRKVTLELGEVSTVIESYLQNCWTWAAKKRPLFDESELVVEILPALTYCEDCKQTYPTVKHGKTCPHCGSEHTYLLQGNEFNIRVCARQWKFKNQYRKENRGFRGIGNEFYFRQ